MPWYWFARSLFTASVILTNQDKPEQYAVKKVEKLAAECAKNISTMLPLNEQLGPVFSDFGIALTSVESATGQPLLILGTANGLYSLPLVRPGVSRLRFELPTGPTWQTYYLSYLHDHYRHRVFEFRVGRPVAGRDELDYLWVKPTRAPHLIGHLDYAVYITATHAMNALAENRLNREQVSFTSNPNCAHLAASAPHLERALKHSMVSVQTLLLGVRSRMPAAAVTAGPLVLPLRVND